MAERTARQKDGDFGETLAAAHLSRHGYDCVAYNYHSRGGEIDIVAQNARYLLFVEVKTRRQGAMVSPAEAVSAAKQRKLLVTAEAYLVAHPTTLQPRFDVVCVELTPAGACAGIQWIENAF
ncbi:MAG: YraN family protein [Oscillospiraceae bacterium]|nr:YraN family protein [Oscillospiraceae bacterium]